MEKLSDYKPLDHNPNQHTKRGKELLKKAIKDLGYVTPMTAASDGTILDGNARYEEVQGTPNEPIMTGSAAARKLVDENDRPIGRNGSSGGKGK